MRGRVPGNVCGGCVFRPWYAAGSWCSLLFAVSCFESVSRWKLEHNNIQQYYRVACHDAALSAFISPPRTAEADIWNVFFGVGEGQVYSFAVWSLFTAGQGGNNMECTI